MSVTTESHINWRDAYNTKHEYSVQLERERANLWGVNEELRNKIASLERGQEDLQAMLDALRSPLSLEAKLLTQTVELNGLDNDIKFAKAELEVYTRFAEKFGDLSCCYDAEDVTAVISRFVEELRAKLETLSKCGGGCEGPLGCMCKAGTAKAALATLPPVDTL